MISNSSQNSSSRKHVFYSSYVYKYSTNPTSAVVKEYQYASGDVSYTINNDYTLDSYSGLLKLVTIESSIPLIPLESSYNAIELGQTNTYSGSTFSVAKTSSVADTRLFNTTTVYPSSIDTMPPGSTLTLWHESSVNDNTADNYVVIKSSYPTVNTTSTSNNGYPIFASTNAFGIKAASIKNSNIRLDRNIDGSYTIAVELTYRIWSKQYRDYLNVISSAISGHFPYLDSTVAPGVTTPQQYMRTVLDFGATIPITYNKISFDNSATLVDISPGQNFLSKLLRVSSELYGESDLDINLQLHPTRLRSFIPLPSVPLYDRSPLNSSKYYVAEVPISVDTPSIEAILTTDSSSVGSITTTDTIPSIDSSANLVVTINNSCTKFNCGIGKQSGSNYTPYFPNNSIDREEAIVNYAGLIPTNILNNYTSSSSTDPFIFSPGWYAYFHDVTYKGTVRVAL